MHDSHKSVACLVLSIFFVSIHFAQQLMQPLGLIPQFIQAEITQVAVSDLLRDFEEMKGLKSA